MGGHRKKLSGARATLSSDSDSSRTQSNVGNPRKKGRLAGRTSSHLEDESSQSDTGQVPGRKGGSTSQGAPRAGKAPTAPEDNEIRNGGKRTKYNSYQNQNTVARTGIRPVFFNDDFSVADKAATAIAPSADIYTKWRADNLNSPLEGIDCVDKLTTDGAGLGKMAAYLLFKDGHTFRTWIDAEVADIVHEYATSTQKNFGRTETTRRPSLLATFRVLRGLEKDAPEAADAIRKLEPTEFTPITDCLMSPVAVSVARAGGADGLNPVGTCIAAMFKILTFSTNAKERLGGQPGEPDLPKILGFRIGDWHRAWVAFDVFLDRRRETAISRQARLIREQDDDNCSREHEGLSAAKKKYNREERILMSIDCTTNLGEALRDRRGRMGIPDLIPIAMDDMAELLKFA